MVNYNKLLELEIKKNINELFEDKCFTSDWGYIYISRFSNELSVINNYNWCVIHILSSINKYEYNMGFDRYYMGFINNSLICYLLGIAKFDPVELGIPYDLLYGIDGNRKMNIKVQLAESKIQGLFNYLDSIYKDRVIFEFGKYYICISDDVIIPIEVMPSKELEELNKSTLKYGIENLDNSILEDVSINEELFIKHDISGTTGIEECYQYDAARINGEYFKYHVKLVAAYSGTNIAENIEGELWTRGLLFLEDFPTSIDDLYCDLIYECGFNKIDTMRILELINGGIEYRQEHNIEWELNQVKLLEIYSKTYVEYYLECIENMITLSDALEKVRIVCLQKYIKIKYTK